jgi:hypothetical protein
VGGGAAAARPQSAAAGGARGAAGNIKTAMEAAARENAEYFRGALRASQALHSRQAQGAARERREGLQSWRMARTIDDLQKPEFSRMRLVRETEIEVKENAWVTYAVLALALFEIHDAFLSHFKRANDNDALQRFSHPSIVLQQGGMRRDRARMIRCAARIWQFWLRVRGRHFERRKQASVGLIRTFVKDLTHTIGIVIAVRKKMKYVRLVQRTWRDRLVLRAARRAACVRQLEAFLAASVLEDAVEAAKLMSMQKQHERELALKKGLHRLAKQESMQKMKAMVEGRTAFLLQRREAMSFFSAEIKFEAVQAAMEPRERDFGMMAYRYGSAMKYYGRARREAQLAQMRRHRVPSLAAVLAVEEPTDAALAAAAAPAKGARFKPAPVGSVRPLRPHFRPLLTADELTAVTVMCVDEVQAKLKKKAEA